MVLEKTTSRWFWKRQPSGGFGKDYLQVVLEKTTFRQQAFVQLKHCTVLKARLQTVYPWLLKNVKQSGLKVVGCK